MNGSSYTYNYGTECVNYSTGDGQQQQAKINVWSSSPGAISRHQLPTRRVDTKPAELQQRQSQVV